MWQSVTRRFTSTARVGLRLPALHTHTHAPRAVQTHITATTHMSHTHALSTYSTQAHPTPPHTGTSNAHSTHRGWHPGSLAAWQPSVRRMRRNRDWLRGLCVDARHRLWLQDGNQSGHQTWPSRSGQVRLGAANKEALGSHMWQWVKCSIVSQDQEWAHGIWVNSQSR